MSDRICIQMPDTLREFLLAMAVVQELQVQIIYGATKQPPIREPEFYITFRLNEKFKYLEPCLQVVKNIQPVFDYSEWTELTRGDYSCFIDFDFDRAKAICKANKLHITEGFSILVGTLLNALQFGMYPQKQPILTPLMLPKRVGPKKIAIAEWDLENNSGGKFKRFMENNYPELEVVYLIPIKPMCTLETLFTTVSDYDGYIGCMSEDTYIAASLDKIVLEIFTTEEDQYLYHNANIPDYMSTVGNPSAEYMWYMWSTVWENHQERLSDTSSLEPMLEVQPESTVNNVDGK